MHDQSSSSQTYVAVGVRNHLGGGRGASRPVPPVHRTVRRGLTSTGRHRENCPMRFTNKVVLLSKKMYDGSQDGILKELVRRDTALVCVTGVDAAFIEDMLDEFAPPMIRVRAIGSSPLRTPTTRSSRSSPLPTPSTSASRASCRSSKSDRTELPVQH